MKSPCQAKATRVAKRAQQGQKRTCASSWGIALLPQPKLAERTRAAGPSTIPNEHSWLSCGAGRGASRGNALTCRYQNAAVLTYGMGANSIFIAPLLPTTQHTYRDRRGAGTSWLGRYRRLHSAAPSVPSHPAWEALPANEAQRSKVGAHDGGDESAVFHTEGATRRPPRDRGRDRMHHSGRWPR